MTPGNGSNRRSPRSGDQPNRSGRISKEEAAQILQRVRPIPHGRAIGGSATNLRGIGTDGEHLMLAVTGPAAAPWTLLLFLDTDCDGCDDLWSLVDKWPRVPDRDSAEAWPEDDASANVSVVAVTRGLTKEDADAARSRTHGGGTVIMSDDAWSDYRVHSQPFFVVVERDAATVVSEGVAWGAGNVLGHLWKACRRAP